MDLPANENLITATSGTVSIAIKSFDSQIGIFLSQARAGFLRIDFPCGWLVTSATKADITSAAVEAQHRNIVRKTLCWQILELLESQPNDVV